MSWRAKGFVRASVGLAASVGVAQAAFFTNGSFETGPAVGGFTTLAGGNTSITGWTVTGASIDYIGTYWQHADGSRSVDLNGNAQGGIEQTFDTVNGQAYTVTFAMAGNPAGPPAIKTLQASAGSFSGNFQATAGTVQNMGWITHTFNFTAQSTSTTLNFASQDAGFYGAAIDHVTVTPVPEPVTLTLAGAALVAGLRRRVRR